MQAGGGGGGGDSQCFEAEEGEPQPQQEEEQQQQQAEPAEKALLEVERRLVVLDGGVCLGLLEVTRKQLVHSKMAWAAAPRCRRPALALAVQRLVSRRLEVREAQP
jgi:hypothetical protein